MEITRGSAKRSWWVSQRRCVWQTDVEEYMQRGRGCCVCVKHSTGTDSFLGDNGFSYWIKLSHQHSRPHLDVMVGANGKLTNWSCTADKRAAWTADPQHTSIYVQGSKARTVESRIKKGWNEHAAAWLWLTMLVALLVTLHKTDALIRID